MNKKISLQDVWIAKSRIKNFIHHTPLIYSPQLSEITGKNIYLKLENVNTTNSFKIRGAANKILSLSEQERKRGITTFSTGNFGLSVAYVAKKLGIEAIICISDRVPPVKVAKLKELGAKVEIIGNTQDDAEKYSYQLQKEKGLTVIHPFDDSKVIAGQGTIGLEILEDLPEVDTVIAGLSGGGLLSGLGVSFKKTNPSIQLIGLSPENGAAMYQSIQVGMPITVKESPTLADSLLGGIGLRNKYTFQLVQQYADDIRLLNEKEIKDGMVFILKEHGLVIEGAAAIGVGALLNQNITLGTDVVIILSGSSVDASVVYDLME